MLKEVNDRLQGKNHENKKNNRWNYHGGHRIVGGPDYCCHCPYAGNHYYWWKKSVVLGIPYKFPKDGMTKGGIFPAIYGTALMVIIMSVAAVPFGAITALYLTEYAREESL